MTFVPTPKGDLQPLTDLYEGWTSFAQQILSRLWHAEQAANWAAGAIADLYAAQPGGGGDFLWSGAPFGSNPGLGSLLVTVATGENRTITFSKTDADGVTPSLSRLAQGATLVLTDDPATPPITAFRQYLVVSNPTDHGSWVSMQAVRTATFGTQNTPPVGSRVRLLIR